MKTPLFLLLLSGLLPAVYAQSTPSAITEREAIPALSKYLGLTNQQTMDIGRYNAGFLIYLAGKERRVAQVEGEIREETAKDVVDPMALGLRYTELEAICREAKGKEADLVKSVQGVLTADQKPKFTALQQAATLLPVMREAQMVNMMDTGWSLVPGVVGASLPGCQSRSSVSGVLSNLVTP